MRRKILIVEDDEKNRMLEKDLLEAEGFEVLEAVNGASGIALALKERPDAIVLDVRLPDMRGTQIVQLLRAEQGLLDIPVIFVSASVIGEIMGEISASSARLVLSKPIDTRTFAAKIRACIEEDL